MECADRIAVLATERTLEPVRALEGVEAPCAVTVRALLARRRFDVTIRKSWPRGPGHPPTYDWEALEVDTDGAPKPDEPELHSSDPQAERAGDPEGAYWLALEAVRRALDGTPA